ncbi:hypothetical protein ACMFMG_010904 [Clarireedia jacksonii]
MPIILSDGNANLVATVSFLIIDSMILFLRLVSKRKTQSGVHLDDWFILAAYLVFAAQSSVIIYDVVAIAGTLDPGLILRPSNQLRMLEGTLTFAAVPVDRQSALPARHHNGEALNLELLPIDVCS